MRADAFRWQVTFREQDRFANRIVSRTGSFRVSRFSFRVPSITNELLSRADQGGTNAERETRNEKRETQDAERETSLHAGSFGVFANLLGYPAGKRQRSPSFESGGFNRTSFDRRQKGL